MKKDPEYNEILEELKVLQQRFVALQGLVARKIEEEQKSKFKTKK